MANGKHPAGDSSGGAASISTESTPAVAVVNGVNRGSETATLRKADGEVEGDGGKNGGEEKTSSTAEQSRLGEKQSLEMQKEEVEEENNDEDWVVVSRRKKKQS